MKKKMLWVSAIALLFVSVILLAYPLLSDWINGMQKSEEIVRYLDYISRPPANKYQYLIDGAREYNEKLVGEPISGDPFGQLIEPPEGYYEELKIPETDVMASLKIPKIGVELPVFHTTSEEVLKKGVGHVAYSSLPVGGKGTHCTFSAHTGYAGLRMFSDLNLLETGDVFYVNCMGLEMAYQVDQIKTVEPQDSSDLQILPDKDYCTLVTCTPFGINSHRLLVRGTRVEVEAAKNIEQKASDSTWNREYLKALIIGLSITASVVLIWRLVIFVSRKRKKLK